MVQQGQELAAAIADASDVMASSGSDGSEAAPLDAQARVQLLLEFLHDRQLDLEELAEERRARFEQCVQLGAYRCRTLHHYTGCHVNVIAILKH